MATLREYFDVDFNKVLSVHQIWKGKCNPDGAELNIIARVHLDFDGNAKWASYYIPASECVVPVCIDLLNKYDQLVRTDAKVSVSGGFIGEAMSNADDLCVTGRLFIYTGSEVDFAKVSHAVPAGVRLIIRSQAYARRKAELQHPLAFISHDSRDKDTVARPIAVKLSGLMCPVWFDEFSLEVGDPLRESIEKGIKECRKCIVVVSPNFLSNPGWTKTEFNSVFTRELIEQQNLFLPELFPNAVDGRDNLSGDSFSVDEHDAVDQVF
jgi:hypothetical protein